MPVTFAARGPIALSAAPATVIWDSGYLSGGASLDGTSRICTFTGTNQRVLATHQGTAGQLVYCEFIIVSRGFAPRIGFATHSLDVTSTAMGDEFPPNSFAYNVNSGFCMSGDGTNASFHDGSMANGTRVGMAWNRPAKKYWATTDGSTWCTALTGGPHNPSNTSSGASLSGTFGIDPAYPAAYGSSSGDVVQICAEASQLGFSVPSGYSVITS